MGRAVRPIPAYIRTVEDENVMELALVENIQREDLNAIEIALAYEHLAETTGMTQEKISEITTAIIIPIKKGVISVAKEINLPS